MKNIKKATVFEIIGYILLCYSYYSVMSFTSWWEPIAPPDRDYVTLVGAFAAHRTLIVIPIYVISCTLIIKTQSIFKHKLIYTSFFLIMTVLGLLFFIYMPSPYGSVRFDLIVFNDVVNTTFKGMSYAIYGSMLVLFGFFGLLSQYDLKK